MRLIGRRSERPKEPSRAKRITAAVSSQSRRKECLPFSLRRELATAEALGAVKLFRPTDIQVERLK